MKRPTADDMGRVINSLIANGSIFAVDDGEEIRYFPAEEFRRVFTSGRTGGIWAAPSLLARHPDLLAMPA